MPGGYPDRYVVIAGHGRSGSNRLLDAFDRHPATFCRNEPNRPHGSPFLSLSDGFFSEARDDFGETWKATIDAASRQISVRDRLNGSGKSFVRSPLRKMYARHVFLRARPRRAAALFIPSLRSQTSPAEPHYAEPGSLERTLPIFKILLTSGWIVDAFDADARMKVILNIRAPLPFLRSWRRRYVDVAGAETVFHDNLKTLPRILAHFGAEDRTPAAFTEAALFESELWRWRYVNELLMQQLGGNARFATVTYEDFEHDPLEQADRLYDFAELEMTEATREKITRMKNTLFRPHKNTGREDDGVLRDVVDVVLSDSPLTALWN
jgi:hypothetical protein